MIQPGEGLHLHKPAIAAGIPDHRRQGLIAGPDEVHGPDDGNVIIRPHRPVAHLLARERILNRIRIPLIRPLHLIPDTNDKPPQVRPLALVGQGLDRDGIDQLGQRAYQPPDRRGLPVTLNPVVEDGHDVVLPHEPS